MTLEEHTHHLRRFRVCKSLEEMCEENRTFQENEKIRRALAPIKELYAEARRDLGIEQ